MSKYDSIHIEEDFWNDFIVEAFEHIDAIESNAMDLEQNPENMDIIHTMFRAFHTIKGLSGFVEHTLIQEVAHKTETLMDYCRKGVLAVNTQIVDAILKSSDYIKQLCNDMDAFKNDDLVEIIEKHLVILEELSKKAEEGAQVSEQTQQPSEPQPSDIVQPEEPSLELSKEDGLEAFAREIPGADIQEEVSQEPEVPSEQKVEEELTFVQEDVQPQAEEAFQEPETEIQSEVQPEPQEENQIEIQAEPVQEQPAEEQTEVQPEPVIEPENAVCPVEEPEQKQETAAPQVFEIQTEADFIKEESAQVGQEPEKVETAEDRALSAFRKEIIEKLKGSSKQALEASKEGPAKTGSVNEEYMKVANYKIDHLVDMIGELIINQSLIEQYVSSVYSEDRQLITNMSGFLRITRDLQNLSMSLRMVSLKSTFQKLSRIARDTIQELGKNVEFVISGENTEIDRVVTEKLLDPLVHLIKNAISHGVEENSQDRVKIGKSERARVELSAYSKRGKIFIEVKDDGRGINTEVVYQKALEKGLVDPSRTYSEAEIKEFIMLPGFSTAKVVDNISGRGVGMDVVKTQILKTGGKVDIQSTLNEGSTFTLEVPVNHAIMNGTIIEMNKQHFVVPTVNVKEFLQPAESQWIFTKAERTMIRVRDNIIPLIPPSVFFKDAKQEDHVPLVMILELDQELRAVPITNVINRQEVVVKPVGSEFSDLKYISGMSILGTGRVSLILDIDYLFRKEIKE